MIRRGAAQARVLVQLDRFLRPPPSSRPLRLTALVLETALVFLHLSFATLSRVAASPTGEVVCGDFVRSFGIERHFLLPSFG